MAYAYDKLGIRKFRAKILETNLPSICLFTSIGYVETKRVAVFREVYMEYAVQGGEERLLMEAAKGLCYRHYDGNEQSI